MKAQDLPLFKLLDGAKQFVVPIFQRTYDWDTKNCEQLWNDILRVGESDVLDSHFIGSVVYIAEQESNASIPRWMLIDGQQRLTTLTLFLIAFTRVLGEVPEGSLDVSVEEIEDYYLKNRHGKGEFRSKLLLTQSDRSTLENLLNDREPPKDASERLVENLAFFASVIDADNLSTAYAGFRKLMIVDVSLKQGQDDPQMIFESMNSTGLDLSQTDLIRNFVLMGQNADEQKRLYDEHWHPMERGFGGLYRKEFDSFVRDFLTVRMNLSRPVKTDRIYQEFKDYSRSIEKSGGTIAEVLADMHQLALYFVRFALLQEKDDELREDFAHLRILTDAAAPLVMSLYELVSTNHVSLKEFRETVRTLESYLVRRTVCDLASQSLPQIIAILNNALLRDRSVDSIKVMLHRFTSRQRFPSDVEFHEALLTRDIYAMQRRKFLLERLENDSKETIDTTDFTIEHILPQNKNLSVEWQVALGGNWQELQETHVHRLGNLTLTGYNEKYSDRWFGDKKTIKGGFDESPLRLNKFLREQTTWNAKLIEQRGTLLADHAVKLWVGLPPSMYQPS